MASYTHMTGQNNILSSASLSATFWKTCKAAAPCQRERPCVHILSVKSFFCMCLLNWWTTTDYKAAVFFWFILSVQKWLSSSRYLSGWLSALPVTLQTGQTRLYLITWWHEIFMPKYVNQHNYWRAGIISRPYLKFFILPSEKCCVDVAKCWWLKRQMIRSIILYIAVVTFIVAALKHCAQGKWYVNSKTNLSRAIQNWTVNFLKYSSSKPFANDHTIVYARSSTWIFLRWICFHLRTCLVDQDSFYFPRLWKSPSLEMLNWWRLIICTCPNCPSVKSAGYKVTGLIVWVNCAQHHIAPASRVPGGRFYIWLAGLGLSRWQLWWLVCQKKVPKKKIFLNHWF